MISNTLHSKNAEFSGDYLVCIRDFAIARGLDLSAMVKDVDLSLEQLLNPPASISWPSLLRVCGNMLGQCDDFYCALLEFALSIPIGVHGVLGVAVKSSAHLTAASELVVGFSAIRADAFRLVTCEESGYFKLRFVPENAKPDLPLLLLEFLVLANINKIGKELLEQHAIVGNSVINTTLQKPANFPHHVFDSSTQINFNQPYMELVFPSEWMLLPISANNEKLRLVAVDQCQRNLEVVSSSCLIKQIRSLLREPGGYSLKLEHAARRLNMSASTLKRRLFEQGTTFMEIKSKDRFELGADLLRSHQQTIETTAVHLGFTDLSNFSKFFKSWSGMTPNQFKNNIDCPRKVV